jgi:serpin B
VALCLALAALPSCATARPPGGLVSKADVAQSDKPRATSPAVEDQDLASLAAGNGRFAFELYRALFDSDSNLFYSPYSISLALAMTYAGARNRTERQMAETLHFALDQGHLHPAFNALDLDLASRSEGTKQEDQGRFRLNVANSIWGQRAYPFLGEFLDILAENYGAGLRLLDFEQSTEQARVAINGWVQEETEGKIKDLLPVGSLDALTRLVLTNAIYFNAAWQEPFKEEFTKEGTFHLLNGKEVMIPSMEQTESFGYVAGQGYQAVELPYVGRELSMVILLPETDQFGEFAQSLDADRVAGILEAIAPAQVHLTMPKFTFESQFSLSRTLSQMGMADAFSSEADFSGMTGTRELAIDDVIHKAFVSVDEEGTEAAAATAVIMKLTMAPEMPTDVTVDHPFIFLIRDIPTGTILFLGHVVNPTA